MPISLKLLTVLAKVIALSFSFQEILFSDLIATKSFFKTELATHLL